MTELTSWSLDAEIEWVTIGSVVPWNWEEFPVLKASIVFADVDRHELFSASGTATSRISPPKGTNSKEHAVAVFLPSTLVGYVREGAQFLVVRGSSCIGVGVISNTRGPVAES